MRACVMVSVLGRTAYWDHTVWTIDVLMRTACVHLLSASRHPDTEAGM